MRVRIKHSSEPDAVPGGLVEGELAINHVDNKLFWLDENDEISHLDLELAATFCNQDSWAETLAGLVNGAQGFALNGPPWLTNFVVNASMNISQERNDDVLVIGNATQPYVIDQWEVLRNSTAVAVSACQNWSDAPMNMMSFLDAYTTNTGSLGTSDRVVIRQPIEAPLMRTLYWGGGGNVQPIYLGFWVKAWQAGNMGVSIRNNNNDRSYVVNVVIDNADTWEYKTATIPGCTDGDWKTNEGEIGAWLNFCCGCGSTYGAAPGQWNNGFYYGSDSPAQTNFLSGGSGRFVRITGVYLGPVDVSRYGEARSTMTVAPFHFEVDRCERYFEKSYSIESRPGSADQWAGCVEIGAQNFPDAAADAMQGYLRFRKRKAGWPAMTIYSPETGDSGKVRNDPTLEDSNGGFNNINENGCSYWAEENTDSTNFNAKFHWTANGRFG